MSPSTGKCVTSELLHMCDVIQALPCSSNILVKCSASEAMSERLVFGLRDWLGVPLPKSESCIVFPMSFRIASWCFGRILFYGALKLNFGPREDGS